MIDKKTFWIGVMTIVTAVLLAAHSMQPGNLMPSALGMSQEAVEHRDYSMATCETAATCTTTRWPPSRWPKPPR